MIHEDAIWRFIEKESRTGTNYSDILKKKLSDVITYINKETPKLNRLIGIYVVVSPDKSAGDANEMMKAKNVFIAIVVDEKGKPIQYIDTGDIRSLLLQLD